MGIGAHAVADNFSEDVGVAAAGMFVLFEDDDAGAFADDETIALLVPGAAGLMRLVVAGGKSAHRRKPADTHRGNAKLHSRRRSSRRRSRAG